MWQLLVFYYAHIYIILTWWKEIRTFGKLAISCKNINYWFIIIVHSIPCCLSKKNKNTWLCLFISMLSYLWWIHHLIFIYKCSLGIIYIYTYIYIYMYIYIYIYIYIYFTCFSVKILPLLLSSIPSIPVTNEDCCVVLSSRVWSWLLKSTIWSIKCIYYYIHVQ